MKKFLIKLIYSAISLLKKNKGKMPFYVNTKVDMKNLLKHQNDKINGGNHA
jgi:hypothetical protein